MLYTHTLSTLRECLNESAFQRSLRYTLEVYHLRHCTPQSSVTMPLFGPGMIFPRIPSVLASFEDGPLSVVGIEGIETSGTLSNTSIL